MHKDKILICDDEEGIRESLKLILSDRYDLIFANSSEEALKVLGSCRDIKVLLLDIKMPGRNGLDVLKEIKSKNKDLSVIIVTGYQSVETAAEAIRSGAANYIIKPLESKTVLETIENTLS